MLQTNTTPRPATAFAYNATRHLFAFILLLAASLKAQTLNGSPNGALTWCAVAIEWLLAAWLLSGLAPARARQAALSLLTLFIAVTGWRLFTGKSDCGCFGQLRVHPALTLALDGIVLISLACLAPKTSPQRPPLYRLFSATLLSLAIPAAILWPAQPSNNLLLLDPPSWPGKPFPLLDFVADPAARANLASGQRTIILFSHECETCRAYLARLAPDDAIHIIDIAPGNSEDFMPPFRSLPLRRDIRYVGPVPWKLSLRDGIVEAADRPE